MYPERPRYVIDRPAYNLPDFDREFVRKSRRFPVGERVRRLFRYRIANLDRHGATMNPTPPQYTSFVSGSIQRLDVCYGLFLENLFREFLFFVSVRCSASRMKALLFRHLPVLKWLPKYSVKENLLHDVISGISAGTIQVPQGQLICSSFCCQ